MTSRTVKSTEETLSALKAGAFNRTTASTNMNDSSFRSHAIFTIYIQQQRQAKAENPFHLSSIEDEDSIKQNVSDLETLTAKFHFVDLAGSERLKRTGATGDRAKEGISINCGLLALGNVISALGDTSRKVTHVPYRDSKLTRMLQDSLGGNSRTLMIACVSPSDRDFMETLNTLKYANRARNIKNRITANQDKTSRTITLLRQEISNLTLELMEYKQGKRVIGEDGTETTNDMYHENTMLSKENSNLRTRIKALQDTIDVLNAKNVNLLAEKELGNWITSKPNVSGEDAEERKDVTSMVAHYIKEIEDLRTKLLESEKLAEQHRKETARFKRLSTAVHPSQLNESVNNDSSDVQELINMAKIDLAKNKQEKKRRKSSANNNNIENNNFKDEDADSEDNSDNSESEDTDTEESDNNKQNSEINEELVELTSEISLKQKLIEELETSQKRLQVMKMQYENKLVSLQNKITATEDERDKVLKNMSVSMTSSGGGSPFHSSNKVENEKVQRIKDEYKSKIEKLKDEVKKLTNAKKEHAKLLRNQSQYERQVDKLKNEVTDMKRSKVKLVQKMKEESNRHRELETKKNRELSQMKKTWRKNESRIRTLESEKKMKEVVLKRKTEEVNSLRRERRMSQQIKKNASVKNNKFNQRLAKSKWQTIEKRITKVALNKQAVSQMENDMERWLKEREKLSHKLGRIILFYIIFKIYFTGKIKP